MEALPLPVVDVGSLRNATGCVDSAGLRTKLAHRIRSALETYGFFYLVGHEVDLSAVDQKVGEFLRRSETDPVKVNAQGKPGGGVSGYYPLESMNTWKIFGREGRPDCHEQFTWKQPVTPEERQQSAYLSSDLGYATNPDNPELPGDMISVLEKGFEEMEAVALLVLSLICEAYSIDSEVWTTTQFAQPNCSSLSYLHYPDPSSLQGWNEGRLRMAPHCDLDVLTMLQCSNSTGRLLMLLLSPCSLPRFDCLSAPGFSLLVLPHAAN